MIDVHTHILPGIDDGALDIEESMQMIREAKEAGFTDIFTTSHYIEESCHASKEQRQKLIDTLNNRAEQEGIDIKLYNGAEVYITPNLIELIEKDEIATLNNTKYLLMELPMNSQIIYLDSIISSLTSKGIIPIIAHPERYSYVQKNPKMLRELLDMGVLLQANYGGIVGLYGKEAQKTVKKLLKENMISFLGTDSHRRNSIYTQMDIILKKLEKLIGKEKLELLTTTNALAINKKL